MGRSSRFVAKGRDPISSKDDKIELLGSGKVPSKMQWIGATMAAKKKVSHIKTNKAEVSIQFRGKAMEIKILLRPDLAEKIAFRLKSPKRFQRPRTK